MSGTLIFTFIICNRSVLDSFLVGLVSAHLLRAPNGALKLERGSPAATPFIVRSHARAQINSDRSTDLECWRVNRDSIARRPCVHSVNTGACLPHADEHTQRLGPLALRVLSSFGRWRCNVGSECEFFSVRRMVAYLLCSLMCKFSVNLMLAR